MSVYILGIDPGSKITGYGVIKKVGPIVEYIEAGIIKTKEKEKSLIFFEIFDAIEKILDRFPIEQAACESQFFCKNIQAAMTISNAKTCLFIACGKKQIPVFEYAPKKAKIAVTGNGASEKQQVQKMLHYHLKLPQESLPLDASDALSLALCHAFQLRPIQVKPC